jgi:Sporulation and spore germination.
MIEDDDQFKQKESFETEKPERVNVKLYAILIIAWFLWVAVFAIIFTPKIKREVEKSGVLTLLENGDNGKKNTKEDATHRSVPVCFYTLSGPELFRGTTKRRGGDKYHDAIEALLEGPDEEILRKGAVTYIDKGTALTGLTYSKGIVYVDLSGTFNNDNKKAVLQIETALKAFDEVRKVVVLKDGKLI